ncbi:MAG: hypothetical protein ACE5IZ_02655 [Dehalococcoidia bacterium]
MAGRRRARQGGGRRLSPRWGDWGWGLALGAIAIGVLVIVVVIVRGLGDGSGGGTCDQPLAPLGLSEMTAAEFKAVDRGLADVAAAARVGSVAGAERAFFGPVHNFTHNVDPPLRERNPELAKQVCERVLSLEQEFDVGRRPEQIAAAAEDIRQFLRRAAQDMGFSQE